MDLRVEKTIELIENTFFELLEEKDFTEITIKEITSKAKINRSTFYRHFLDKYQLRDQIIDRIIDDFDKNMEVAFLISSDLESDDYVNVLNESLLHLMNNKDKYEILWNSFLLGRNVFEEMIEAGVRKMKNSIITNEHISTKRKERAEWYSYLLVNNLMVSARWWFKNKESISSMQLTNMIIEHMENGTIPTLMN